LDSPSLVNNHQKGRSHFGNNGDRPPPSELHWSGRSCSLGSSRPKTRTAPTWRFGVSNGGGNGELGLWAGIDLTPNRQLTAPNPGAFMHAGQAVVSSAPVSAQNLRVNALSVVAHSQPELPPVIADFHFNPPRTCVAEGIAHGFAGNAVH